MFPPQTATDSHRQPQTDGDDDLRVDKESGENDPPSRSAPLNLNIKMSPIPTTSLPHDAYTKVLLLTSKVFFYFVLNTNAEVLGMRRYRDEAFVLVFLGTAQHGTTLPLLWYTFDQSRRGVQMARNGGSVFPRQGGLGLGLMLQAWDQLFPPSSSEWGWRG